MPSEITQRPIKSGCNYNAVGNPIVYTFTRKDYAIAQVNNNGGFAQVQINGIDLTSYFEVGNSVYVFGYGLGTITASAFSGGNTLVTVDIAFVATGTGYVNNLSKRTDYKIEVEIYDFATELGIVPIIVANPGSDGIAKIDVSIVKAFLNPDWTLPAGENAAEAGTTKKFFIVWQDFWDDTYQGEESDIANPIIGAFSVMHLLQQPPNSFLRYAHGGNMLSYFPEDEGRDWLIRMDPTYWRGFPFTISFIWPETFEAFQRRVVQYDGENNEVDETTETLDPTDLDTIHRMTLGDIHADATRLVVSLEMGGSGSGDLPNILDELEVKVVNPCANQVLLFWKNALGGDTFWMFDEAQDYQWIYPNGKVAKRLQLTADNLSIYEWDQINGINSPTQVIAKNIVDYGMDDSIDKTHFRNDNQVYIINDDGTKLGVIVIPTDNRTKTIQRKHFAEITIELPEFFTVQ